MRGETGATGYNAYQVAQVNGFDGSITEWLASLKGDMGNTGMTGATGFSAYDVAVGNGFEGSITQWLGSLKGTNGTNGISKEVMDAADTYILNEAKTYVNQVGQQTLNQANAYTDSRVNALNRDMRKLEDRTYAAVASSIAIASLPQPTDAGYNMFSAGVGTWEGEQGYAFGLSGATESNKYVYKVAVTTNSEGDFGAGAAIGWQWK
ncbi:YadA-like family protein [Acinetobacter johnsonii]|nr:YadA-like family protein [Acinetobacter johnsonii]